MEEKKQPNLEGLKEIARWAGIYIASFVASWFLTETLNQVTNIPEFLTLNVWVFAYLIPVRQLITFTLTLIVRYLDKYLHELGKLTNNDTLKGGITRF